MPILLLCLIYAPEWVLRIMITIFIGQAVFELTSMLLPACHSLFSGTDTAQQGLRLRQKPFKWLMIILSCGVFLGFSLFTPPVGYCMVFFGILLCYLIGSFMAPTNEMAIGLIMSGIAVIGLCVLPFSFIWEILILEEGRWVFILLLIIVWCSDTGGYFGGRFLGKHRLHPRISPNKTWEGAVIGLLAAICGALVYSYFLEPSLGSFAKIAIAGAVGSVFGQMGDLVESVFKRFCKVKDSGTIFPGHGGFLDRVDGVLFAAPVIWFIFIL